MIDQGTFLLTFSLGTFGRASIHRAPWYIPNYFSSRTDQYSSSQENKNRRETEETGEIISEKWLPNKQSTSPYGTLPLPHFSIQKILQREYNRFVLIKMIKYVKTRDEN